MQQGQAVPLSRRLTKHCSSHNSQTADTAPHGAKRTLSPMSLSYLPATDTHISPVLAMQPQWRAAGHQVRSHSAAGGAGLEQRQQQRDHQAVLWLVLANIERTHGDSAQP